MMLPAEWLDAWWIGPAVLVGSVALFLGFLLLVVAVVGWWQKWKYWMEEREVEKEEQKWREKAKEGIFRARDNER